ncbi:MAG TPA: YdcF family protein [Verrucomicrobiae bacterium]|nr:YdcF family protein [Verrucomicrobiae bacterium]
MNTQEALHLLLSYLSPAEDPLPADAVIAFGNYHAPVAQKAAQLVLDGLAPLLVCTGGKSTLTEHLVPAPSEAEWFADIAMKLGVPKEKILMEPHASNTGENVQNALHLLQEKGIQPKTLLFVSIPFHLRRVQLTFAKQAPDIRTIPIRVNFAASDRPIISKYSFEERILAELERLHDYPAQGFTVPADIPPQVLEAESILRSSLN